MKVRRYKWIQTEIIEEKYLPSKRRPTVLPVPLRPVKSGSPLSKLGSPQPAPSRPQFRRLPSLLFKALPLAILAGLSILLMSLFTCALVGLFSLPTPDQKVALTRRPVVVGLRLPTFTPTPIVAVAEVAEILPTPAEEPTATPTATLVPLPTSTPVSIATSPAAASQNDSRPTLTSRVALNVRSGPGLEHGVVGQLTAGQSTSITGQNPDGNWWQIEYPSGTGQSAWVSADPQYSTVSQAMPQIIAQAATPTAQPLAAATPIPSSSTAPAASGWTFNGITQLAGSSEEGLLLMGELVNDTGAPQQMIDISGAFYDAQGQITMDSLELVSYVPIDPVPANAHVPFELLVSGNRDIDRFDLQARSEPASDPPRQDFQFLDVEQWVGDTTGYCLRGQVDNQGPPIQEYLLVLAIGYDEQGRVVNFGEYYVDGLSDTGAQSAPFELCLASLGRQLSRHDLRAFGD